MCGIVGYIGKANAASVLIGGLKRLEYRGYDSAGLALIDGAQVKVSKASGKVANLSERAHAAWDPGLYQTASTGIAHTRWATHGPPTEVNAHPHLDETGDIALVHNGIIENYRALRARMESKGHHFHSETDTEVLAHLIGDCYKGDLFQAVCDALHQVEGTFGIAVVSAKEPGKIITARRGSPIVIGVGDGEAIIASDASAILAHTQRVIYLDDNDIAIVSADAVDIRDLNNVPVTREIAELGMDEKAAEKGGYEHFMLKEIHEQPDALSNATRGRLDLQLGSSVLAGMATSQRELAELSRVVMVGCGTSLHAAMVGEYAFEDIADINAEVQQAAEFRYRNPIMGSRDFVVAISQSGETADTLAAVREAQQKGAFVMSLVNVVGSTIARETGRGVYLHAGPEISVASTKAFTCQVSVLLMMALKLGRGRRFSREEGLKLAQEIHAIPELVSRVIEKNDMIAEIAAKYLDNEHAFFIGRGPMYPVALEGALKLKEISYIHAEGYHAAELKHGPIALLQPGTPVIAVACEEPAKDKTLGNVEECRARGARILGIVTEGDAEAAEVMDDVISIPRAHPLVATIPAVVALQLFSYHVARLRGCEIDQPRNLAKSVTVE
ncbi:MAG: glutamine--fructose-6-phosphate transaminase (isomerizing) [Akkermansiaceae bacterium]|nr:glutamine--fructose-6-phosphate transaminase (isomerizing) [Akkermansiaceae bacterium]MDP4645897.1 glutamine--fructose-6-phosphate transaminase (isomerizing) [Akkermansiaceae bacterium]MDP4720389.1 glutamine--fructose-6-phosphate transaminase (isomerizing) [Akkermansiaceae bacterium]MDP4779217.1 glutamine--fructose-6-phosphate transaminase (isomerizing) [Akkermansiaceae bacterium]MDP4848169.1 glutamine--fructose-6-phosphate transaminase (isomerizing) [Akkermansiaceae bacterium]